MITSSILRPRSDIAGSVVCNEIANKKMRYREDFGQEPTHVEIPGDKMKSLKAYLNSFSTCAGSKFNASIVEILGLRVIPVSVGGSIRVGRLIDKLA